LWPRSLISATAELLLVKGFYYAFNIKAEQFIT